MSSTKVSARLRNAVRQRADGLCEYCKYPDGTCYAHFNCDHCTPEAAGGQTVLTNLAWACPVCNGSKGGASSGVDPKTGDRVPLFNPRSGEWDHYFGWTRDLLRIVPKTAVGRATEAALRFNRAHALVIRSLLLTLRLHPARKR